MPDTITPEPPRDVPLSFHHAAVALRLHEMFEAGEFDRLNLARRKVLRTAILHIEQLGELADEAERDAGDRAMIEGISARREWYDRGVRDGALIERSRILGLPWWRRMMGRVG